jgi:hypothetical protein
MMGSGPTVPLNSASLIHQRKSLLGRPLGIRLVVFSEPIGIGKMGIGDGKEEVDKHYGNSLNVFKLYLTNFTLTFGVWTPRMIPRPLNGWIFLPTFHSLSFFSIFSPVLYLFEYFDLSIPLLPSQGLKLYCIEKEKKLFTLF